MSGGYNYSLTTFSPSGKLVQIEYALNAVSQGVTAVGVKGRTGSVIVTERKSPSPLVDDATMERIAPICDNIGLVYAGMGPDARVLLAKSRKAAQTYRNTYGEYPPVYMLVREVAAVMQEYTQSGGVRPFGVSLLVVGIDDSGPSLYQVDPSGAFWAWKASAVGRNMINAKSFLEKRYADDLEVDDAVHTALLTLKEGFEGQMSKDNIEIGIANATTGKFTTLSPDEIQDYLSNL
jgi:20S proteasome subunit alpha 2